MAIVTPTIKKIIRMTEFDLLRTAITVGNMYICTDSFKMYYDESKTNRALYNYTSVKTVNDLLYNITPSFGISYYCWEDNSLWLWMNKWITLYSANDYPSGYIYDDIPSNKNPQTINGVYSSSVPIDENGLLHDGSVVVRDRNRIIKGKFYINDGNDNLVISSYLGGGIRFLPNGHLDEDGEMFIGDEGKSFLRSELTIKNNEEYVDYTEKPENDNNPYKNDTHRYKVFHEGNLDASLIHEITPQEIYDKLRDKSLKTPLQLDVAYLGGKPASDYTLVGHKHISTDITDFNTASRQQANIEIKTVLNTMVGEGITISYDNTSNTYKLSADSWNLDFGGGVQGSGKVDHLTNTTINLTVDPDKHIHKNYITRMDNLQTQINNLKSIDPDDYYTITQIDTIIQGISGTTTPTPGKPLLVNSDYILPGTSRDAKKLTNAKKIICKGDITGTTSTDFSGDTTITLDASNIVSVTPTPGKTLKLDDNGNLPTNALTSSALNHTITINLTDEVTGSGVLDTTKNSLSIDCTLTPNVNTKVLTKSDLGVTVANIDPSTGKIPAKLIPLIENGLVPKGTWDPSTGDPVSNPTEGNFYIAIQDGLIGGKHIYQNDWYAYLNNQWNIVNIQDQVTSVNNKTGDITLTPDDVNSISKSYIDYIVGATIPGNKLVLTSDDGKIEGATVSKLTNAFKIKTDSVTDVEITSKSSNVSTDGSKDFGLQLNVTQTGYNNIQEKTGYIIQNNNVDITHRKYLNFGEDFKVTQDQATNTITVHTNLEDSSDFEIITLRYASASDNNLDYVAKRLGQVYDNRANRPILIILHNYNDYPYPIYWIIDGKEKDPTANYSFNKNCYRVFTDKDSTVNLYRIRQFNHTIVVTFDGDTDGPTVSKVSLVTSTTRDFNVIPTNVDTTRSAFIPANPNQPATKSYVDSKVLSNGYTVTIGDGTNKEYTIKHNLNSYNVITQFRLANTKEECFVSNQIVDANTIKVSFNKVINKNEIIGYVFKIS